MQNDLSESKVDEYIVHVITTDKPKTVKQLVKLVQLKHPIPEHEIMEHILNLQNQGKLTFKQDTTFIPLTLKSYLSSPHSYWYWAIITLALTTTLAVFTIPENAHPIIYARYMLGSVLVLLLPGYSLIKALYPTRELDKIERLALSIGMSLVLLPITGLLLNYTPWGIRTTPVTLSLLALTTILATAAIIREHQVKLGEHQRKVRNPM